MVVHFQERGKWVQQAWYYRCSPWMAFNRRERAARPIERRWVTRVWIEAPIMEHVARTGLE